MDKRILVILNPSAGPAQSGVDVRRHLADLPGTDIVETESSDDAVQVARQACEATDIIVACGGDGTVNSVINGMMAARRRPSLAVVPLGTANNLCRTLDIPLDPVAAAGLLTTGTTQAIDLVHARSSTGETYFANVASGGNSDRILESISDEDKQRWGPWCYLRCALPVIADLQGYEVRFQCDGGRTEADRLWNVLIANGKDAGGMRVTPYAEINDGLLDVVLIKDGSPLDLTQLAAEFVLGEYLQDERVQLIRGRSFRIDSDPEIRFLADGEWVTGQPYEFSAVRDALKVVVPSS